MFRSSLWRGVCTLQTLALYCFSYICSLADISRLVSWVDSQMSAGPDSTLHAAVRERMRQESSWQSDRIWSELTAAEGCDCRLLQFNREEQQRYQWLTTAVSASAREWCLMDEGTWYRRFHWAAKQKPGGHLIFHCPLCPHCHMNAFKIEKMQRTLVIFVGSWEMCFFLILQIRNTNIWHSAGWESTHRMEKVITHSLML